MKRLANIMSFMLTIVLVSACGKIGSKAITAKMLNMGRPDLYVSTLSFTVAFHGTDSETFPIGNSGFREGEITDITLSNAQYVLNPASDCAVGTVLDAGSTCNIQIDFTPAALANVNATMTISYEGAGGSYSAVYPLEGTVH